MQYHLTQPSQRFRAARLEEPLLSSLVVLYFLFPVLCARSIFFQSFLAQNLALNLNVHTPTQPPSTATPPTSSRRQTIMRATPPPLSPVDVDPVASTPHYIHPSSAPAPVADSKAPPTASDDTPKPAEEEQATAEGQATEDEQVPEEDDSAPDARPSRSHKLPKKYRDGVATALQVDYENVVEMTAPRSFTSTISSGKTSQ